MSRKIVVTGEQVAKVTAGSSVLFSGEVQKKITVSLKNGDRIVMREGSVEFQRVGLFIKLGDIMSFEAAGIRSYSFKPDERQIELTEIIGLDLSTLTIEAGLWDEAPFEGLQNRTALTEFAAPRTAAAPPLKGDGQFSAPVADAEPGVAASGTHF